MNTNPNAKRILCYGDSNTWGAIPFGERYPLDVRWTGILQNLLGDEFEVIEEGLKGRTTNLEDPTHPDRNGLVYLRQCIPAHYPVDLCILWLGTNDLKKFFNRSAKDIAEANKELIKVIRELSEVETKILLVSSPLVFIKPKALEWQFDGADEKSKLLGKEMEKIAKEESVFFIDLAQEGITPDPEEGVHLSPEMHAKIAEIFSVKVKSIFK